jgi:hypothetical protein
MRGQYKNTKLRSTLEDKVNLKLQEILGKKTDEFYEAETIEYTVPEKIKRYTPDFKIAEGVFIETKGIWDKADRDKILLVKQQRPDIKILMLFWNAGYKIYPRSKTTYATFCDTNGIEWADIKYGIPDKWLEYIEQPKKTTRKKNGSKRSKTT